MKHQYFYRANLKYLTARDIQQGLNFIDSCHLYPVAKPVISKYCTIFNLWTKQQLYEKKGTEATARGTEVLIYK